MSQVEKLGNYLIKARKPIIYTIISSFFGVINCQPAFALSSSAPSSTVVPFGDQGCLVDYNFSPVDGLAIVGVSKGGTTQWPGGAGFVSGSPLALQPTIDLALLNLCFSGAGVSNLSQTGPSGAFETADYLGFSFEANNQTFAFALVGAVDRIWIVKVEPIGSPETSLEASSDKIHEMIKNDAVRSLHSTIWANQRMARDARDRFIAEQNVEDRDTEQSDVPFDVNGSLDVDGATISSKGAFHGAQPLAAGIKRLMFGDFDVQHDNETGSSTATLTGRVAWERMVSDRTLLGYFVGGELAYSNISDAFSGNQNHVGVTAGSYAVHELAKNTYVDGFVTFGVGRNNLEVADDVLVLESDYITRSVTFGSALSSVIEQSGYEIRPELSLSYGKTWIGDVGFTGSAYGLVDNTLSLDAGSVTLASIMFRPEFRVPLNGLSAADSLQLFSFAPRLMCEQIKATVIKENCGGGVEIGFTGMSIDGLSTYSAKIVGDRLGNRTSGAVQLNLEHRF